MEQLKENNDIIIKDYNKADLTSLVSIINNNYLDYPNFFYEFIPYTYKILKEKVESRSLVFVAKNHETKGFIACFIAPWGTTIDLFCVKICSNRNRIEEMLITKVEKESKGSKVVVFLNSVSPHIQYFEKRGYEIYGGLYLLTLKLDHVFPIPKKSKNVNIRNMTETDEEIITNTFYDPKDEGSRIFKSGFSKDWKPEWNIVAESDNKIVAIVCTRPEVEYNKYYNKKRAEMWGPNVITNYRRKGLAKRLTCEALNLLIRKGIEETSFVATEECWLLDHRRKLGFKVKNHQKFLRRSF